MDEIAQKKMFEGWAGQIPADVSYEVLVVYARYMRNNPTPAEKSLWELIRREQLHASKFRRQHIMGRFIVDFYCPQVRLVIEVDGSSHNDQAEYDAERTEFLETSGVMVIRFTNEDVLERPAYVLKTISKALFV